MANKGKRMVFEDEYNYLQELIENHSDPSAEWGGEGSTYTAGDGISINAEDVISIDSTVALKTDIVTSYNDLTDKPTIPSIPVVTITTTQGVGSGSITADEYNALLNNPNAILILKGYYGSDTEVYLKQSFNTAISAYLYYESNVSIGQSSISTVGVSIRNDYTWLFDGQNISVPTNLATVATTGSYNDLTDKPTIPTVDYPVTDVQVNSTSVVTNKVANILIPTYTTLFDVTPTSGTAAYNITLSDDITKYDEIKIYYNQNDGVKYKNSITFPKLAVGDILSITAFGNGTNRLYTKNDSFEVSTTTSLVLVNSIQQRVGNNEATQISAETNQYRVRPYKIIGIKY